MITIIGFIGMLLILLAFIMNQTKRWKDDSLVYDGFNAIGSGMMVIYAIVIKSYPFLILNSVWFIVSVRDIYLDMKKAKKSKGHLGHKRK